MDQKNVFLKEELYLEIEDQIFSKIESLMKSQDVVTVAIDGMSGSGKSTFAHSLGEKYDCNVFHMDDFFLRPELRTEERLKEIGGNVDYVRFKEEIISGILSNASFLYQAYDCQLMALTEKITIIPKKLNIIEGAYSVHPSLVDIYDLKVFFYVDKQTQSDSILKRNGAMMHKRFIEEWIPKENKYIETMRIKEQCDFTIRRIQNESSI